MNPLIAVVARGLEDIAAREIRALGGGVGKTRKDRGRVVFQGPDDAVYRANLQLQTVDRILVPLADEFEAGPALALSRVARELPWERYVPPGEGVRIVVSVRACKLFHTGAVEDAIREALVYRGLSGEAPGKESLTLDVRGTNNRWTLAVDSSGAGLHRRGYRKDTALAPVKETLAAAMLHAIGWTGEEALLDPMCGAGTLPAEAALIASRRPAGLDRPFAFERWASFDPAGWTEVVGRVTAGIRELPAPVVAADAAPTAIRAARGNLGRLPIDGIKIVKRRIQDTPPNDSPGVIVMNPPYGKRLDPGRELDSARGEWRAWADLLRARRPKHSIYALSPDEALAEAAGASGRPILRFSNGGIPVALVRLQ